MNPCGNRTNNEALPKGEDLNRIPGLTNMVKGFLDAIEEKGMLNVVKEIC